GSVRGQGARTGRGTPPAAGSGGGSGDSAVAGPRPRHRGSTAPPPRVSPARGTPARSPAVSSLRPSRHGRHTASRAERRSPEQRWHPHLFLRDHGDLVVPAAISP